MPWVRIQLQEQPYVDKNGKLLNRPLYTDRYGLDVIYGGGKKGYPEGLDRSKVIEWVEKAENLVLLIHLNATVDEAATLGEIITDDQAEVLKQDVFGISAVPEVTN